MFYILLLEIQTFVCLTTVAFSIPLLEGQTFKYLITLMVLP